MNRIRVAAAWKCLWVAALPATAGAQVVNSDFETGSFAPWTMTNTPQGRAYAEGVSLNDMDGNGPLLPSLAARFIAGQNVRDTGPQGIELNQPVMLVGGRAYVMRFDWHAHALVNFHRSSAGTFSIIVDGAALGEGVAPNLASGTRAFGSVEAIFTPPSSGTHLVGVRITRTVPVGEEQLQYVDNFTIVAACIADVDDGSGTGTPDGGVTIEDLLFYISLFETGAAAADVDDGNGTGTRDGGVTIEDLLYYLVRFDAGC